MRWSIRQSRPKHTDDSIVIYRCIRDVEGLVCLANIAGTDTAFGRLDCCLGCQMFAITSCCYALEALKII